MRLVASICLITACQLASEVDTARGGEVYTLICPDDGEAAEALDLGIDPGIGGPDVRIWAQYDDVYRAWYAQYWGHPHPYAWVLLSSVGVDDEGRVVLPCEWVDGVGPLIEQYRVTVR